MNFFGKKRVFLDYAGGGPIRTEVQKEMSKNIGIFANPSGLYLESQKAKELIISFRTRIAKVLNVNKNEIVFTSGGTEGNNLALLGVFEYFKKENFIPHIITLAIEHSSTLEVCSEIERRGGEVTILPVGEDGIVSLPEFKNSLKKNTVLVSFSLANSEIGAIQPLSEISKIIKTHKEENGNLPYLHLDTGTSPLYLSLDVARHGIDLLTLDSAKVYGPKGVGALFVKSGTKIMPIIFGGGQERGLRSGTENLLGISGFSLALELANNEREAEAKRLTLIRDYAIEKILKDFPNSSLNGSLKHRLPNNINICFPNLDAEFATIELDLAGFSVSYSSSCMTLKDDFSSYVIKELNKKEDCSKSSLRLTLGKDTNKSDIDNFIIALKKVVLK
jgi:cysteine desulfurase